MDMSAPGHREPREPAGILLVRHVMSPDPLLLRADMRLERALELLVERGYSGAPVVDEHGRLVGVLNPSAVAATHLLLDAHSGPPHTALVGHATGPAVTITQNSPLQTAAARMWASRTDRLVVVRHPLRVVGVLTGHDLLRAVARRGDLLQALVDARIAALDLGTVHADADATGTVLLTGSVRSTAERDRLVRSIGAIPGVAEVDELVVVAPPGAAAPR